MMEMMAAGKPVVLVNWCGATQFMNESNPFLIEPEDQLEDVHPLLAKYRKTLYAVHKWAAVKPETVGNVMTDVFEDREKRERKAREGKHDIYTSFSFDKITQHLKTIIGI